MAIQNAGLSNVQQELLKLYGNNVFHETLLELKGMLARFFADRASDAVDNVWEQQDLTPADMINWANDHKRTVGRRASCT